MYKAFCSFFFIKKKSFLVQIIEWMSRNIMSLETHERAFIEKRCEKVVHGTHHEPSWLKMGS
jgi:phosphomevalonate kinase